MPLRRKRITYRCTAPFPDIDKGYVKIGRFPSGVNHNCVISIFVETKEQSDYWLIGRPGHFDKCTMNIQVQKSNDTPAKVDMKLYLTERSGEVKEVTKSVDYWETSCYFTDCENHSLTGNPSNLVLEITWTVSKPSTMPLNVTNFLMNATFSDVSIVIGDEKLLAHKMILGAASPVMVTMLTSPMKEANCIEIKDVEVDAMKAILRFLYTGDYDFENADMALKVLAAADKYDMKIVKDFCAHKLLEYLSVTNALEILSVADTHKADSLVKEGIVFIASFLKEIVNTEYFNEFCTRKPHLLIHIIRSFCALN